jgi:hypothetical protein
MNHNMIGYRYHKLYIYDIDIINIQFEYSDTDTVLDVEYPDSNTNKFELL